VGDGKGRRRYELPAASSLMFSLPLTFSVGPPRPSGGDCLSNMKAGTSLSQIDVLGGSVSGAIRHMRPPRPRESG
jgi:hypothetical protein